MHAVTDLDTGRPAVEQNSAHFEFQQGEQQAFVVVIGFVGVDGRRQLAFDVLGDTVGVVLGDSGGEHRRGGSRRDGVAGPRR
jgi:hypothetical protein